jgi:hypothetical protein
MGQGNVAKQFRWLADYAGIPEKQKNAIMALIVSFPKNGTGYKFDWCIFSKRQN